MPTRNKSYYGQEKRAHYRVVPPSFLIKEFALWFMPPHAGLALPLTLLGMPHHCNINALGATRIEDIAGGGIRFSFPKTESGMIDGLRQRHCYVYLKLRHPIPTKMALCCLFLGLNVIQASVVDGRVHVRSKILSRGVPAQSSKQFQLFDVSRVGVRELNVWCEEIARTGRGITPPPSAGIDIEYLLLELGYSSSNAQGIPNAPPQEPEAPLLFDPECVPHTVEAAAAPPPNAAQAEVERLIRATGVHPAVVKPA